MDGAHEMDQGTIYRPNYLAIHIHLHFVWPPFFFEQHSQ